MDLLLKLRKEKFKDGDFSGYSDPSDAPHDLAPLVDMMLSREQEGLDELPVSLQLVEVQDFFVTLTLTCALKPHLFCFKFTAICFLGSPTATAILQNCRDCSWNAIGVVRFYCACASSKRQGHKKKQHVW